jgi:hypothetical protein
VAQALQRSKKSTSSILLDSAPSNRQYNVEKKRKPSRARLTASKNDKDKPTWEDDPRPIILHGDQVHNNFWLTVYLGFDTKYLLRNLAVSPLVPPWAVGQNVFKFPPNETAAALTMLSEGEEFGDRDTKLDLKGFAEIDEISAYILPYQEENSSSVDPKEAPTEERTEALVRILSIVHREFKSLCRGIHSDEFRENLNNRRATTEDRIRRLYHMRYFGLPDIPLDRLRAPELGPLEFNGRKEHVVEKWVRILTLSRYAYGRVAKSKYTTAGCIGDYLGDYEIQRINLSEEVRCKFIDRGATKSLGLGQDWADDSERIAVTEAPI